MKKIVLLMTVMFGLFSCTPKVEETVNSEEVVVTEEVAEEATEEAAEETVVVEDLEESVE